MVLQKRAMIADRSESNIPRIYPAPTGAISVIFATAGADKVLPVGTVVAYNTATSGYVEWANAGADGTADFQGVVHPVDVQILLAGEVAGVIMVKGEAHRSALLSDGGTSGQLDTMLAAQALGLGVLVRALPDVVNQ